MIMTLAELKILESRAKRNDISVGEANDWIIRLIVEVRRLRGFEP